MNDYRCSTRLEKKVRRFMRRNGLSQRDMADISGVSHKTIWRVRSGMGFNCQTCAAIMDAMGER